MDFTFQLEDHLGTLDQSSQVFGQHELPNQYAGTVRNLTPEVVGMKANHGPLRYSNDHNSKRSDTTNNELCSCDPVYSSVNTMPDKAVVYTCAGCGNSFKTVCELHKHIIGHGMGGSYKYNHNLRTAYLTFDTVCASTQTYPLKGVEPYQHVVEANETVTKSLSEVEKRQELDGSNKGTEEAMSQNNIKLEPNDLMNISRIEQIDSGSDTDVMDEDYIEQIGKQAFHEVKVEVDNSEKFYTDQKNVLKHTEKAHKGKKRVKGKTKCQQKKMIGKSLKASKSKKSLKIEDNDEITPVPIKEEPSVPNFKIKARPGIWKASMPTIPCDLCEKTYSRIDHLHRHQQKKHPEKELPPKKKKDFKCEFCEKAFSSKFSIYPHHQQYHPDKELKTHGVYYCHWCGKAFNRRQLVKEHSAICDKDESCRCFICEIKTETADQLKEHLKTHNNTIDLQCKICKKRYVNEILLHEHMKRHKMAKNMQCGKCGKKFRTQNQVQCHENLCGDAPRPFQCDQCQQGFKSRDQLKKHVIIHSDKRPYMCEICGYKAKRQDSIINHMRIHSNKKPFQCKTCGKQFSGQSNLRRHRLIHTNTRSFVCVFCGKAFATNWNRNTHERTHTGDAPYKCQHCGEGFRQNVARKQHIRTHHPFLAVDSKLVTKWE